MIFDSKSSFLTKNVKRFVITLVEICKLFFSEYKIKLSNLWMEIKIFYSFLIYLVLYLLMTLSLNGGAVRADTTGDIVTGVGTAVFIGGCGYIGYLFYDYYTHLPVIPQSQILETLAEKTSEAINPVPDINPKLNATVIPAIINTVNMDVNVHMLLDESVEKAKMACGK